MRRPDGGGRRAVRIPGCSGVGEGEGEGEGEDPLDDDLEDNDTLETAGELLPGEYTELFVAEGDDDWYAVDACAGGTLTATLTFVHADGDLDLAIHASNGARVAASEGSADEEALSVRAEVDTTAYVRVYGFFGAANTYDLSLVIEGC